MSGAGMKPEMVMLDQACAAAGGPPHMAPVVFALPPERQLSVQIGEVDRQLSTRSNAPPQANKCFPVEYCNHDNGLFAHIPVVYPPTVSLQRKVTYSICACPHP